MSNQNINEQIYSQSPYHQNPQQYPLDPTQNQVNYDYQLNKYQMNDSHTPYQAQINPAQTNLQNGYQQDPQNIYHPNENMLVNESSNNISNNPNYENKNVNQIGINHYQNQRYSPNKNKKEYIPYPSKDHMRYEQNLEVYPYRDPNGFQNYNPLNYSQRIDNQSIKNKIVNAPNSDKIDFENENQIKQIERQRYKQDLDYLVNLKKYQGVQENSNYNNRNSNENRVQEDKIKELENKAFLRNIYQEDLDNFNRRKQIEKERKNKEMKEQLDMIEYNNRLLEEKQNNYKRKIEGINDKIYQNTKQYNDYFSVLDPNIYKNPNDFEVNKKLSELRELEKEKQKNNFSLIEQRLKEDERQKEYEMRMKQSKIEHQNMYKNLLDSQIEQNNQMKPPIDKFEQNKLLPGYNYMSRPYPSNKKAMDSIHLIKNNVLIDNNEEFYAQKGHIQTLLDAKNKRFFLGNTNLNHNPITDPVPNLNYNKYLDKHKRNVFVNNSQSNFPSISKNLNNQSPGIENQNTFKNTANTILN